MRSFLFKRGFILPVVVTGVVPLVLALATGAWRAVVLTSILPGSLLYAAGLSLLILTTGLFARHYGSLAPWNPPTEMVVVGPYRYCRNPMIIGVYAMLLGETVALQSAWVGAWFLAFVVGMSSHIVLHEEPGLQERFGEPYNLYCKNVPRWLPRVTPYSPSLGGVQPNAPGSGHTGAPELLKRHG
jgi:protein-S-isoprenylcysteine O-methyltransferase Ste14